MAPLRCLPRHSHKTRSVMEGKGVTEGNPLAVQLKGDGGKLHCEGEGGLAGGAVGGHVRMG